MDNFSKAKSGKRIIVKETEYSYKNSNVAHVYPIIEQIQPYEILKSYNIISISDINDMDLNRFFTVNLLLNSWISVNYDKLKNNKSNLKKICIDIIKTNDLFDINKDSIDKYIDYWTDNFIFDKKQFIKITLLEDLLDYLKKKSK